MFPVQSACSAEHNGTCRRLARLLAFVLTFSLAQAAFCQDEAETTLFDLYLDEGLQGGAVVSYGDDWFEVQSPDDVVEQIPFLKNPQALRDLLTGRIAKKRQVAGLGSVTIDLATFRLVLSLSSDVLASAGGADSERLPASDAGMSLQQGFSVASSGEIGGDVTSSLNYRSIAAVNNFRIVSDGTLVQRSTYQLTDLALSGEVGKQRLTAGFQQTEGRSFSNSLPFAGFSIGTAEEVLVDQEKLIGSQLEVFVPSDARVEFYRGERLLASQALHFGLQEVDTSSFPQGSYSVDILMHLSSGEVRRERKFFSKSNLLGLRGIPKFEFQAGVARDDFSIDQAASVVEGIVSWRAFDWLEMNSSYTNFDADGIWEAGLLCLFGDQVISVKGARSNAGDVGVGGSIEGVIEGLSWNISILQALSGFTGNFHPDSHFPEDDPFAASPLDRFLPEDASELTLMPDLGEQHSASLSTQLGPINVRFSALTNRGGDNKRTFAYGPRFNWQLLQTEELRVGLQAAILASERGRQSEVYLGLEIPWGAKWTTSSALQSQRDGQSSHALLTNAVNYFDKDKIGAGDRLRLENKTAAASLAGDELSVDNSLEFEHSERWTNFEGFLRNTALQEAGSQFGLAARSSLLKAVGSNFSLAPKLSTDSALIAELEGRADQGEMELVVNGQVMATMRVGSTVVIPLAPYATYKVILRPTKESQFTSYDTNARVFTLFPGNVVRQGWAVRKVFIGLGKLVDNLGKPVSWQRIQGLKDYTVTEADGSFQAELNGDENLTISGASPCTIRLPKIDPPEAFYDFGVVNCE